MYKTDTITNLFDITPFNFSDNKEIIHTLFNNQTIRIEHIISYGQTSNEWYNQQEDEWVVLLQGNAKLVFKDKQQEVNMSKGDFLFIPAHKQHKVSYTSQQPQCIWLAIFLNNDK